MHHAHVYVGAFEDALSHIDEEDRTGGADVFVLEHARFSIAEARMLKDMAFRRPVERPYRTFVLTFTSITVEAQNALLKLFEEPPETARFHIVIPREDILIPTLWSRLHRQEMDTGSSAREPAMDFLQRSYRDRLEVIAEHAKQKDDVWMDRVLSDAEVYFGSIGSYDALKEIAFVRTYFHGPGASKKMLLEHLALTLPEAK